MAIMVMYYGLKCHKFIHYGSCHKSRCLRTVSAEQIGDRVTFVRRSLSNWCLMRSKLVWLQKLGLGSLCSIVLVRTFISNSFASVGPCTLAMMIGRLTVLSSLQFVARTWSNVFLIRTLTRLQTFARRAMTNKRRTTTDEQQSTIGNHKQQSTMNGVIEQNNFRELISCGALCHLSRSDDPQVTYNEQRCYQAT